MKGRAQRTAWLGFWAGLTVQTALLFAVMRLDDDRWSAVLAAGSFGTAVLGARLWLRLDVLSPALTFLYVLGVFHLGMAVPWALGLGSDELPRWFFENRLTPALALVVLAFGGYQLGLSAAVIRRPAAARRPRAAFHNTVMYQVGLAVMAAGWVALIWGVRTIGFERMANATYFDVYRLVNTYDPRLFTTSLQIAPMGLYLAAAAAPRNRLVWTSIAGGVWISTIFLIGFRGFALVPLATTAAVLAKRGLRPARWAYPAAAIVLLLAIPAVRGLREGRLSERSVEDLLTPSHPLAAVEEMGGSLRPLVHTVDLMANEDYRAGTTYLRAAAMVVPNLSLEWSGDRYLPVEELPPSHWVSRLAAPWHYAHHGGLGFSAVAEAYMNWGPVGIVAVFALLGAGLVWADRLDASRPARLAAWAMVLGPLLWTTRNSAGVLFRPAVWGLMLVAAAWTASQWSARLRRPAMRKRRGRKVFDVHAYDG